MHDHVLAHSCEQLYQIWMANYVKDEDVKPFWQRRSGLSVLDDCILWGSRVYIPRQGRQLALRELHDGHPRDEGTGQNVFVVVCYGQRYCPISA